MLSVFLLICLLSGANCACSGSTPFDLSGQCYAECPWNPPTLYFSNPTSGLCQTTCSGSLYGLETTKRCTSTCPSATYYDSTSWLCRSVCPAGTYGYLGAVSASNQRCVTNCPAGSFADDSSRTCIATCPVGTFYVTGSSPRCVVRCPPNNYGSPIDRICYTGGTCPANAQSYYADDTTNKCVLQCPSGYFADSTTGRCQIYCSSSLYANPITKTCVGNCPVNYFRSDVTRTCLLSCTVGQFADSTTQRCTTTCSAGTYGDSTTGTCTNRCTYPNFGDSTLNRCVSSCSLGLYADNYTMLCVAATSCYTNTIGDPTTRRCILPSECPTVPRHFANMATKLCVTLCAFPLWGDVSTRSCVSSCPWNPKTYVSWMSLEIRQCVTVCPEIPIKFADNVTRSCVANCPQYPTAPYDTFADQISQQCVRDCPTGYLAQKPENMCVSSCATTPTQLFMNRATMTCVATCPQDLYADPFNRICTSLCPAVPELYGYDVDNTCVNPCPGSLFSDPTTRMCVPYCPETSNFYADSSTKQCVDKCPMTPDLFGDEDLDSHRVCVSVCQTGTFADPITRTCVPICDVAAGYWGSLTAPVRRCVEDCPSPKLADDTTGLCVTTCPRFPVFYFGNTLLGRCVAKCPQDLYANRDTNLCVAPADCSANTFADDVSQQCVLVCPLLSATFGDSASKRCIQTCPEGNFADPVSRRCETTCNVPAKLYKDPSTKRCVVTCPSSPNLYNDPLTMTCSPACTNSYYAYDVARKCVANCPATPPLFGDSNTLRCVSNCTIGTFSYSLGTTRICTANCPSIAYTANVVVDLFADNTTNACVPVCPANKNLFAFKHPTVSTIRLCVPTCPVLPTGIFYFADSISVSCVLECPTIRNATYGDKFNQQCVKNCSRNQYRDNTTRQCTYSCSPGYFADETQFSCQPQCPKQYFAESTNRTCVKTCPAGTYADSATKTCKSLCLASLMLWSNGINWTCVKECPNHPNLYADPNTVKCQQVCTGGLYADNATKKCVPALSCSNGWIGDSPTKRCVPKCSNFVPSYRVRSSNTCVTQCSGGLYADNFTGDCQAVCSSMPKSYAYDAVAGPVCTNFCPYPYYSYEPTRRCLTACPAPNYFQDTLLMQCVTDCSGGYFAESVNGKCVESCSVVSQFGLDGKCYAACTGLYSADSTSHRCVLLCPFGYFSQNNVCVTTCVTGLADPITKRCELQCSFGYYSKLPAHTCVRNCTPQYRFEADRTCKATCPRSAAVPADDYYMDTTTRMCLNKCMPGTYADGSTGYCQATCSSSLFADNFTLTCVSMCPQTPVFTYGYNRICYDTCPAANLYGQNLTNLCTSSCPAGSYADDSNRRCMDVCTNQRWAYASVSLNKCLDICPEGFYAESVTRTCVPKCPDNTYGQNDTNICVDVCPTGTYADSHLNICVLLCDGAFSQFADDSTKRCVQNCPVQPSLYAQTSSRSCVSACVSNWFAYNITRVCIQNCPSPYYADTTTGYCLLSCPELQNLYADDSTRRCQATCPNVIVNGVSKYTYRDNSTMKCVFVCPFAPSMYGFNDTNTCVENCPAGTFGDSDSRLCISTCDFNVLGNGVRKYTWADPFTSFCSNQCTPGSYADNVTVSCTQLCSLGTYADWSSWRCTYVCPSNPTLFAHIPTRSCISNCPSGLFGDEVSRTCLDKCPSVPTVYYRDSSRNLCVKACNFPLFGQPQSGACAPTCVYGYFPDQATFICQLCPSTCMSCLEQLACTSCQPGLYLYQGSCIEKCPQFPIRYYAQDNSASCKVICPSPLFGFAVTGKCQLTCPTTYYSDLNDQNCKSCPVGCLTCSAIRCESCLSGYIYVEAFGVCKAPCNSTHPYYVKDLCALTCPLGTYLLNDLVTCQRCSLTCETCSGTATNCTKCRNKFMYSYECVQLCPTGTYVDQNQSCRDCTGQIESCKQAPLSYTVKTYTESYTLYADIVFNRAVNLTLDAFSEIVQIKTTNGSIKASQYSAKQKNSTTFNIEFYDSSSLNQMSLSIGFPTGFIFDSNGSPLAQTSSSTTVDSVTAVSSETTAMAQSSSSKVNSLSWVLILLVAMMMIKSSYPLVVLMDSLQFLFMHLYISVKPLPYLWLIVMKPLDNLHFTFLPKLFTPSVSPIHNPYSAFQDDISFLGNLHPMFFIFLICSLGYLLAWGLSRDRIQGLLPNVHKRAKRVFKYRLKYSILHEMFYYTEFYAIFWAAYQFKGYSGNISQSAINIAIASVALIAYVIWICGIWFLASKYKERLNNMPKRFNFLVIEKSQFPVDIPLRALLKMMAAGVLVLSSFQLQIIFLIIFNLLYFVYTALYSPSQNRATNYVNLAISACFGLYEGCLYTYASTSKSTDIQMSYSYGLLANAGFILLVVFVWTFYRFVLYIRESCFGIKPQAVPSGAISASKKESKKPYNQVLDNSQLSQKFKMSRLELAEFDEESEQPNIEKVMEDFTYHMVPAKNEAIIKEENRLLGIKQTTKKRTQRMVIQIDEDELLDGSSPGRRGGRLTGGANDSTIAGHLRINQRRDDHQIEQIRLVSASGRSRLSSASSSRSGSNQVIWDNQQLVSAQDSDNN